MSVPNKQQAVRQEAPATVEQTQTRDPNLLGSSFIFPPNVIDDIHVKSELGRYRMRGLYFYYDILMHCNLSLSIFDLNIPSIIQVQIYL